jgi:arylsulfatase A-like enzyme
MDRRTFLVSAGAGAAGSALGVRSGRAQTGSSNPASGPKPNILFILVDELRYPSVFPSGVSSVDQFLASFMPNVYALWQRGVKFGSHYTAATACSPARGVLISGLYSQQSWLLQTIKNGLGLSRVSPTPPLNPVFPTYGKLLRRTGYETPYIGKWHVSIPPQNPPRLEAYGFTGLTWPDPDGANLQGTVGDLTSNPPYLNDQVISNQAVQWLSARQPSDGPWCLTVGFVNPHDQQFFWAGTEFQTYNNLFAPGAPLQPILTYSTTSPPIVSWDDDPLKSPPPLGYPTLPPNWQSAAYIQANKPSLQYFAQTFSDAIWGGVSDDSNQADFTIQPYPNLANTGIGVAPYSYWQRCLDSYTNVMSIVDQRIGEVVSALPVDVAQNTIIIFASDHGEYAGAHGFVAGKVGSCYEEPFHIPLIVVDPSGRFVGDIDTIRTGLTSSVDMLALLVSLGHNGSRSWMIGNLAEIYGQRHDMLPMLQSASAAGRPHVLLATDELVPGFYFFNDPPPHVAAVRTQTAKLGAYAKWDPFTGQINPATLQTEFYDYSTPEGAAELVSNPNDPRAGPMLDALLNDFIPNELRAPLPGRFGVAQNVSKEVYLLFQAAILNIPANGFKGQDLRDLFGFGQEF